MAPNVSGSSPGSSSGVHTGAKELTQADWQSVMEGILHTNEEQGRQQILSTVRYFQQEGKLPAFMSKLEEIFGYCKEEQRSPGQRT